VEALTPRETELASLVAAGFSNRQIAEMLAICRQTVKNHIQAIYRKLQLRNRVELSLHLSGKNVREMQGSLVGQPCMHLVNPNQLTTGREC
jgi:DNA-binding NarL/FixJ family response regulator